VTRKPAATEGRAPPYPAHDPHRRRGPRPKYDPALLLPELWQELEANPGLKPRDAARHVAERHRGGDGSVDNRARHLMRLVEQELQQPRPLNIETLFLWERVTREGQRFRRRRRDWAKLRAGKMKAASSRWGALYWKAEQWFLFGCGLPRVDNNNENLGDFLASLDWWMKFHRDLIG
jgi:hypothetical protein